MDHAPRRLFIALPVDDQDAVRSLDKFYQHLKKYESFLKIVPPDNYHITLKFFGSVESGLADSITEAFLSLNRLKMVEYKIEGAGSFPSADHPSVIWAGLKCDEKPLAEILQSVESLASSLGFPAEKRKFIPHLTLARLKKERSVDQELKKLLTGHRNSIFAASVFRELVLYESVLKRTGAEYKKVEVVKLV